MWKIVGMNWQGEAEHFVLLIGNDLIYTGVIISTASLTVKKKNFPSIIRQISFVRRATLIINPSQGSPSLTPPSRGHMLLAKGTHSYFGNHCLFPRCPKFCMGAFQWQLETLGVPSEAAWEGSITPATAARGPVGPCTTRPFEVSWLWFLLASPPTYN